MLTLKQCKKVCLTSACLAAVFVLTLWLGEWVRGTDGVDSPSQVSAGPFERETASTSKLTTSGRPKPAAPFSNDQLSNAVQGEAYSSRPDDEWQGMPVDETRETAACHSKIGCGLGLACVGGRCVGCAYDDDCMEGEQCVLQHCLKQELVTCVGRADCEAGEKCILSGVSAGPRGNETMSSSCLSKTTEIPQQMTEEIEELQANIQDVPQFRMTDREQLLQILDAKLSESK